MHRQMVQKITLYVSLMKKPYCPVMLQLFFSIIYMLTNISMFVLSGV